MPHPVTPINIARGTPMNRALCLIMLASVLGLTDRAWAAAPGGGAPPASGVFLAHINLSVASTLPAGSIILCKGELVFGSSELNGGNSQPWPAPLAEEAGTTVLRGSTAECALEIPFSWTGNRVPSDVAVCYEIDAISGPGGLPVVLAKGTHPGILIAPSPTRGVLPLRFRADR